MSPFISTGRVLIEMSNKFSSAVANFGSTNVALNNSEMLNLAVRTKPFQHFRPTVSATNGSTCASANCGEIFVASCTPIVAWQHLAIRTTAAITRNPGTPIVIYDGGELFVLSSTYFSEPIFVKSGGTIHLIYYSAALAVFVENGGRVVTQSRESNVLRSCFRC
jgi:hypothetical protein